MSAKKSLISNAILTVSIVAFVAMFFYLWVTYITTHMEVRFEKSGDNLYVQRSSSLTYQTTAHLYVIAMYGSNVTGWTGPDPNKVMLVGGGYIANPDTSATPWHATEIAVLCSYESDLTYDEVYRMATYETTDRSQRYTTGYLPETTILTCR